MRIGVVGINHKLAELQMRELLAKACERHFAPGRLLHAHHTFVLLSTCNRTEVYFSSEDLAASHSYLLTLLRQEVELEFDQKLYSFFGIDCFLHLCRVTSGLDSAIVAETEIQRQVKAAYEGTFSHFSLPSDLHYLFQKSLKIAKEVRTKLPLKPGLPGLEHAILNVGEKYFEKSARILFVGSSNINIKILRFLKAKHYPNITLCNRTRERAVEIASHDGLKVLNWEELFQWPAYDWIICGTKSPDTLIHPQSVEGPKLLIDLSVPRNISPLLGEFPNIVLRNIDQIDQSLQSRRHSFSETILEAEKTITEAAKRHIYLFQQKTHGRLRLAAVS